jgi:hypothetical protein
VTLQLRGQYKTRIYCIRRNSKNLTNDIQNKAVHIIMIMIIIIIIIIIIEPP